MNTCNLQLQTDRVFKMEAQLPALLAACLSNDNTVRKQAEEALKSISAQPAVVPALLQTIQGAPDAELRHLALSAGALNAGFGPALASIAVDRHGGDPAIRQLAAVVLKKLIKEHWDQGSRQFKGTTITEDDKAAVRSLLPNGLSDPVSGIRTCCSMAIAAIATSDLPASWPGLIEWLVGAIRQREDHNLVHGALRCLALLAGDIDESQLGQVMPVLLPQLLSICQDVNCPAHMQHRALIIVHQFLVQLGYLQGAHQRQVRDLLAPYLAPWLPTLTAMVSTPLTMDPTCWAVKMEVLKIAVCLISYFTRLLGDALPALLAACWKLFMGEGVAIYQAMLVDGQEDGQEARKELADEEGDIIGLDALFSMLFELLLAITGSQKFQKLVKPALRDLSYTTISYMQMTADQREMWSEDANAYVADEEEETCTARVSGELLLDELCQDLGKPAVLAVLESVERRLAEAHQVQAQLGAGRDAGPGLMRLSLMREAALLALGSISDHLAEVAASEASSSSSKAQRAQALVNEAKIARRSLGEEGGLPPGSVQARVQPILTDALIHDLQGSHSNHFLAGRALWAAAKLCKLMSSEQVDVFLSAAAAGVRGALPPPVRIGACRALVALLPLAVSRAAPGGAPNSPRATMARSQPGSSGAEAASAAAAARLAPLLPSVYEGLIGLLSQSKEETLHLVLETLAAVIKCDAGGAVVQQVLGHVAGPVLQVWEAHVADPLVGEDALSVLEALSGYTPCLLPLAQEVLPALVRVISSPSSQPPMMVEGSLDLLRTLANRKRRRRGPGSEGDQQLQAQLEAEQAAEMAVARKVYQDVAQPLLSLIHSSDDPSIQRSAQQLLCQLIRTGRTDLLSWGPCATPGDTLAVLLACASYLLGATNAAAGGTSKGVIGEMEGIFAGHVLFEMLLAFPHDLMQPHIHTLIHLVAQRLVCVNMAPLVSGLILVLSHFARLDAHSLVEALAGMQVTLQDGTSACALDVSLPVWLERCGDVSGRYRSAVAATALGALLESGHPRLAQLQVRGRRLDLGGGVRTRSQSAASGGEQYSRVPATAKLLAALAELLADAQEASARSRALASHQGPYCGVESDAEEEEEDEWEEGDESEGSEGHPHESQGMRESGQMNDDAGIGMAVTGAGLTPAEAHLVQATLGRSNSALIAQGISPVYMCEGDGGDLASDPLSPQGKSHEEGEEEGEEEEGASSVGGYDEGAPPGDPLSRLDVPSWVCELLTRVSLTPAGQQQLKAALEHAMTKRQAGAINQLLQRSRLRAQ